MGRSGDPSPVTAFGTYRGMKACALRKYGDDDLGKKTIAIQGVGHVGYYLARNLAEEGAKLFVTDIDQNRVDRAADELGAVVVDPDEIYDVEADIFAPCALGAVLNSLTIPRLQGDIVAGGCEQPAGDRRGRQPPSRARHPLRAGLRHQCRRLDQRVLGTRRLDAGSLEAKGR